MGTTAIAGLTAGFTDARPVQQAAAAAPAPQAGKAKKISPNEVRKLRTEVSKLEEAVAQLEAKQAELAAELESPDTYAVAGRAQHLNRELTAITDQITTATQEWEAAALRLEEAGGEAANG